MRLLPVAALAVALLLPGSAHAAAPATTTVAYRASSAVLANPGRGFFTYTETHLNADGSGWEPLAARELAAARVEDARSVVFRDVYLEKYVGADTISGSDLALIRADFAAVRAAGVKLVIRFAYTTETDQDAPVARVVRHIGQLGPILTANADVILAVQAGFVGRWGEWYYSRNFASDAADPGRLSATDWANRRRVLAALLAATAPTTLIQVRTPQIKRHLAFAAASAARIGVHDDCFLAGADDYGTYTGDDTTWLTDPAHAVLVGGETCDPSARSGWATASRELATYHWTYLNPSFNQDVLDSWGVAGRTEASKRLGYRLELIKAVLPATAKPGTSVTARITLVNGGYAAPAQSRPVRLMVGPLAVTIASDVRTWQPGKPVTLTVTFRAPAAGSYPLALSLPDASLSDPAYAIQLANTGTWDAARGGNRLGATLTVSR